MRFSFLVAKRYLLARKSHNIINLISAISLLAITVGTMALITVLSVFNGFESLVSSLFNAFNPDIEITAKYGKTFDATTLDWEKIRSIEGVRSISGVLEEKALFKYRSRQIIVTLKGVGPDYGNVSGLDTMLYTGQFAVRGSGKPLVVCGFGIAYQTDLVINDFQNSVELYLPKKGKVNFSNPAEAFQMRQAEASGIFSVQQEFDMKYVFVPITLMQDFLESDKKISSLEIRMNPGSRHSEIQGKIASAVGPSFLVKNKYQQEELLYKIMRSEKWAIFLILTFILIIATFNVIGSLTMLILEKRKDISILFSLGASEKTIRRIFLLEGWLISFFGAIFGLCLGWLLCYLQQRFGLIKLGGDPGAFLVQAYPVDIQWTDFIAVFITVNIIGLVAALFPVSRITQRFLEKRYLSS